MATIRYKGFELSPAPYQLHDTGKWEVRITITRHHDARGETLEKQFSASNTIETKEDAERHALEFGKQIINGEHETFSVDDLL